MNYISPEMAENNSYNYKIDIWSLGIIMFYMVNGFYPFEGDNCDDKFEKIINSNMKGFKNSISENLKDLILNLLKKNPEDRITFISIFKHPWMKFYEEFYKINFTDYIYDKKKNDSKNQKNLEQSQKSENNKRCKSSKSLKLTTNFKKCSKEKKEEIESERIITFNSEKMKKKKKNKFVWTSLQGDFNNKKEKFDETDEEKSNNMEESFSYTSENTSIITYNKQLNRKNKIKSIMQDNKSSESLSNKRVIIFLIS